MNLNAGRLLCSNRTALSVCEIAGILKQPDISQTFVAQGGEVIANTPEEFRKAFFIDVDRLGKVIQAAGIKAE